MNTECKLKATAIVEQLNEKVRLEVIKHKDNYQDIAQRAGISAETLSNFTCQRSDLCHVNLLSVWLALGNSADELKLSNN